MSPLPFVTCPKTFARFVPLFPTKCTTTCDSKTFDHFAWLCVCSCVWSNLRKPLYWLTNNKYHYYTHVVVLWHKTLTVYRHGPLARYVKLRVRMRRECRERFPRHRRWAIPTCITARASRTCRDACRDRQLSVSFEIGGGGKRSRHSRRMRNLQFYVSGKRPMDMCFHYVVRDLFPAGPISVIFVL